MEIISQREFGRRVGVSEGMVRKAIDNGWIIQGRTTRPSGTPAISYEIALEEWKASPGGIQAAAKNPNAILQSVKRTPEPKAETPAADPIKPAALFDPELAAEKAKIIKSKGMSQQISIQRAALALQKEQGKLVDKEQADKQLFEFGQMLSESILTVPHRIIDQVRTADRHTGLHLMLNELKQALRGLDKPPDLTKY